MKVRETPYLRVRGIAIESSLRDSAESQRVVLISSLRENPQDFRGNPFSLSLRESAKLQKWRPSVVIAKPFRDEAIHSINPLSLDSAKSLESFYTIPHFAS